MHTRSALSAMYVVIAAGGLSAVECPGRIMIKDIADEKSIVFLDNRVPTRFYIIVDLSRHMHQIRERELRAESDRRKSSPIQNHWFRLSPAIFAETRVLKF